MIHNLLLTLAPPAHRQHHRLSQRQVGVREPMLSTLRVMFVHHCSFPTPLYLYLGRPVGVVAPLPDYLDIICANVWWIFRVVLLVLLVLWGLMCLGHDALH